MHEPVGRRGHPRVTHQFTAIKPVAVNPEPQSGFILDPEERIVIQATDEAEALEAARGLRAVGFIELAGYVTEAPVTDVVEPVRLDELERLLEEGVFVTGFGFPVVPKGTARLRIQMSAAFTPELLDRALAAFERIR